MNATQRQPHEHRRPSRARQVVAEVCRYYGVDEAVLLAHTRTCGCPPRRACRCGKSPRSAAYCEARMLIAFVLDRDLAVARMRIALLLCRDHGTIYYNVRRAEELLAQRRDLRWHLEQLRAILREKGVLRARCSTGRGEGDS